MNKKLNLHFHESFRLDRGLRELKGIYIDIKKSVINAMKKKYTVFENI